MAKSSKKKKDENKQTNFPSINTGSDYEQYLDIPNKIELLDDLRDSITQLGNELTDTTVSKEYFNTIFSEQDNHVFITNFSGIIFDFNKYPQREQVVFQPIGSVLRTDTNDIDYFMSKCTDLNVSVSTEGVLSINNKAIPVSIKISVMKPVSTRQLIVSCTDLTLIREKEKESLKNIIAAQEQERNRVAQDLHDEIGQQINGLRIFMNVLEKYIPKQDKPISVINRCNEIIDSMSQEIRAVCFNLMPRTLNDFGLITAVDTYIEKIKLNSKANYNVKISKDFPRFNSEFEINIYRIIQEFVSNSVKYSEARNIGIELLCKNDIFTLTLTDDGKGFVVSNNYSGMGLRNIETRCKFINAKSEWKSKRNQGTKLTIQAPCPKL